MQFEEIFFVALFVTGVISEFVAIAFMFYIGKTRIKEIDKVVYGYKFPHDSIFSLMLRIPNYGGAFLWEWNAKRSGLKGKIEHFDRGFKWPFVVVFVLTVFGFVCLLVGSAINKLLLGS